MLVEGGAGFLWACSLQWSASFPAFFSRVLCVPGFACADHRFHPCCLKRIYCKLSAGLQTLWKVAETCWRLDFQEHFLEPPPAAAAIPQNDIVSPSSCALSTMPVSKSTTLSAVTYACKVDAQVKWARLHSGSQERLERTDRNATLSASNQKQKNKK